MIKLPEGITDPIRVNPKILVAYSKPKVGKTDICSKLENSLLIDLEDGSDFVRGTKVKINNLTELKELGTELRKANYPYKYGIVDTLTALEDMILPLACKMYRDTPMGKNWVGDDVKKLPNGAGYLYLRNAFFTVLDLITGWFENVIFLAHLKEKLIETKGEETSAVDIDLVGKLKSLTAANADAIAYMHRKEGKTVLNFKGSDEVICGARSPHLTNQEIIIAEKDDSNNLITYWDRIYIKENK